MTLTKTVLPHFLFSVLLSLNLFANEPTQALDTDVDIIRIPSEIDDPRSEYIVDLLSQALSYQKGAYRFVAKPTGLPQARDFSSLKKDPSYGVVWGAALLDREEQFRVIKIPLFKGLFGWRVLLVNEGEEQRFKHVEQLDDFRQYSTAMHYAWSDLAILERAKIPVETVTTYESLFYLLHAKRIDYLSRSAAEVSVEIERFKQKNLVAEKNLLLHYPFAMYFYFNKSNERLANRIEKGLLLAKQDGSFERIFQTHFKDVLNRLDISNKNVIYLENPSLPPDTPLENKDFWITF